MLNVKSWIVAQLKADSQLTMALGSADKIVFEYPNDFNAVPVLTYSEVNQSDDFWRDDGSGAVRSLLQFDVWTANNSSTSTIAGHVARIMAGLFFTMEYSADMPDPDGKLRHRVMRFSRSLTASDIS